MRDNTTASHTLAAVAREACLSPFHFHRCFRACFGETPHQYLSRLRLEEAAGCLRCTTRPVAEIAVAVGFESPAHFSRAFKRRFGATPQQYRRGWGQVTDSDPQRAGIGSEGATFTTK